MGAHRQNHFGIPSPSMIDLRFERLRLDGNVLEPDWWDVLVRLVAEFSIVFSPTYFGQSGVRQFPRIQDISRFCRGGLRS